MIVNYALLFDYRPVLALHYDAAHPTMRWRMNDMETGQTFARASTLAQAVQFMRTAARKGDASVDELSVEFHLRLADPGTWSVRVGALSERVVNTPSGQSAVAPGSGPTSPRSESAPALATILPFRRPLEPLDEGVRT